MKKKTIKVNLWDWYDRVELAAQRIALIERELNFGKQGDVNDAFDFIMSLGDKKEEGVFTLKDFDGYAFYSCGRVKVEFSWEEGDENSGKVVPEILFELA